MKTTLSFLSMASVLLLLASCGGPGTTSTKLEISNGFIVANSSFPAGLIVVGEKVDGSKKFSTTFEASNTKTIELEKGAWKIWVVGWKGDGNPATPNFNSTNGMSCGSTTVDLSQESQTVEVAVTSSECSSANFTADTQIKDLWITSCGAFYDYNSASNNFGPIAGNTFCDNVPSEFQSPFTHYRLFSMDTVENKLGFASDCRGANYSTIQRLTVPTAKFPFTVKLYRNAADCGALSSENKTFELAQGIAAGNPSQFDHDLAPEAGALARLVLPSSMTNRGRSPFMNLIPRILCSSNDCLPNPSTTKHVNVPWTKGGIEQVLLRGVSPGVNTCPAGLFPASDFFSIQNCKASEGQIRATVYRNELSCQDATMFPGGNIIDMYARGNYIYIITRVSGPVDYLNIYNKNGSLLSSHNLGISDSVSITATDAANPTIYLSTGTIVKKTTYNSSLKLLPALASTSLSGLIQIEVAPDDSLLFATFGNDIRSYTPDEVLRDTETLSFTPSQLQYVNNKLYVLEMATSREFHEFAPINTGNWVPRIHWALIPTGETSRQMEQICSSMVPVLSID